MKVEFLKILLRLKLDPARMHLLMGFFDTYLVLDEEEEAGVKQALASWTRYWKPALWNEFIERYHYLGSSHLFGARVRYRGINAEVAPLTHTHDTQRETPAAQGLDQPGRQGLYYCTLTSFLP